MYISAISTKILQLGTRMVTTTGVHLTSAFGPSILPICLRSPIQPESEWVSSNKQNISLEKDKTSPKFSL